MDNIIQFPTKGIRDWSIIERSMKDGLTKLGISQSIQERLTKRMKSFYEFLNPDFNFTVNLDFAVSSEKKAAALRSQISKKISAASEEKLQAFTQKLFIERFEREMECCRELGIWH